MARCIATRSTDDETNDFWIRDLELALPPPTVHPKLRIQFETLFNTAVFGVHQTLANICAGSPATHSFAKGDKKLYPSLLAQRIDGSDMESSQLRFDEQLTKLPLISFEVHFASAANSSGVQVKDSARAGVSDGVTFEWVIAAIHNKVGANAKLDLKSTCVMCDGWLLPAKAKEIMRGNGVILKYEPDDQGWAAKTRMVR